MRKIIIIVDDNQSVRKSLRGLLLEAMPDCSVIEAADGEEAIESAYTKSPDIVIMDIGLPAIDGIKATKIIHAGKPELKIIMLSVYEEDHYRQEAKLAGASGYVAKRTMHKDLMPAVKQALKEAEELKKQNKTDEKLSENEEKYKSMVENIGIGISVIGPNMEILDMNRQMKKWFPDIEVTMHPLCYRAFNDPPKKDLCSYCPTCKTLSDGQVHEAVTATPAGNLLRHYRIKSSPLKDADGTIRAAIEMVEDITERLKAETELRNSEKRYRALFANMLNGFSYCRMLFEGNVPQDFIYLDVNSAFEKLTGLKNVVGKKVTEVIPGIRETDPELFEVYGRAAMTGKPEMAELYVKALGTWFHMAVYSPEKEHFVAIFDVITERKQTEQKIQRQLNQLAALRDIDIAITSSLDLRVSTNIILKEIISQLSVDAADILLLHPDTQTLTYADARGFRTSALKHTQLRLGDGHAGRAALERRTIRVQNVSSGDDNFLRSPLIAQEGFADYFGLPLISKGQVKGVLEIFHRTLLHPDEEWLDFLEALGAQTAIAVDNALLFHEVERSNAELILAYETTLEGWSRALDYRDKETEGHSLRVTDMTVSIARAMGLSDVDLAHIRRGALLHDIGKLGVPDNILLKPGKLTDEEWLIMKKHPTIAYELLSPIPFLKKATDIPYCHHEKWNGTGYPRGLKGEEIPIAARMFSVVDVWDALRSDRPYRQAWSKEKTMEYILQESSTGFDPKVVEVFMDVMKSEKT